MNIHENQAKSHVTSMKHPWRPTVFCEVLEAPGRGRRLAAAGAVPGPQRPEALAARVAVGTPLGAPSAAQDGPRGRGVCAAAWKGGQTGCRG